MLGEVKNIPNGFVVQEKDIEGFLYSVTSLSSKRFGDCKNVLSSARETISKELRAFLGNDVNVWLESCDYNKSAWYCIRTEDGRKYRGNTPEALVFAVELDYCRKLPYMDRKIWEMNRER